ncbi:hypothetical protein TcCL_Unassigned04660 [Trypanosoma cruzi]|nr:hypothetical protein TcCL_Unassigned04660 [Trypanosoma cruzi]
MEGTPPLAYRSVVVSVSKDPVEYFVRAKGDGRTVVPAQTERRTGWLMWPVTLRSQLRHWMRAGQVALRCLLASRPTRWYLLKGIQEHLSSEGVSAGWSAHCSVRSIGLFLWWEDGLLHFLDFCGEGGSWGKMPTASVLAHRVLVAALRRRHNLPLQDESNVFLFLASNGRSSCYVVRVFLQNNEFANGYEGCVTAGFERRWFFFDGRCLGITGACRCCWRCEGRCFSHPKRGFWEGVFYSCGGGRYRRGECAGSPPYFLYCFAATTGSDRQPH